MTVVDSKTITLLLFLQMFFFMVNIRVHIPLQGRGEIIESSILNDMIISIITHQTQVGAGYSPGVCSDSVH